MTTPSRQHTAVPTLAALPCRAMKRTNIGSLPATVVEQIIQQTRSRRIAGTNAYARVCRSWQQASTVADHEQLHLLMDVSQLSEDQLASAMEWFSRYGQQVDGMDLRYGALSNDSSDALKPVIQQLLQSAPLLSNLTRLVLYINHTYCSTFDTLGDLMKRRVRLPCLQHLEASTDLASTWCSPVMLSSRQQQAAGMGPPMQRLLPALTSLSLLLEPVEGSQFKWGELLPAVLPSTLQQLQLSAVNKGTAIDVFLDPGKTLGTFSQLRRLGLADLELYGDSFPAQVEEVHLLDCLHEDDDEGLALFADKVTRLASIGNNMEYWGKEGNSRKLTAIRCFEYEDSAGDSPGWEDADMPSELPQLQRLELTDVDKRLEPIVEQLAGLSSLRELILAGQATNGILEALGQVTQLTALHVADLKPVPPHGQGAQAQPSTISRTLQQLPGLRQLTISHKLLMEQGRWLPCLTQLTMLAVQVPKEVDDMMYWWECTSQWLQAWLAARPASLRHLRFFARHGAFTYTALPSPVPGLSVMCAPVGLASCWPQQQFRLVQPCPHLPGVMEVLGK